MEYLAWTRCRRDQRKYNSENDHTDHNAVDGFLAVLFSEYFRKVPLDVDPSPDLSGVCGTADDIHEFEDLLDCGIGV